ncbi:MAG: glycosyltransferase family 4 protein [Candidatus Aquicultorales bacterium]
MKLGFVIYHLPPEPIGGAELYALSLGRWLGEKGHRIELFGAGTKARFLAGRDRGLTTNRLPTARIHRYYSYFPSLWWFLRNRAPSLSLIQGFDITHLSGFTVAAGSGRAPVVLRVERELAPHVAALGDTRIPGLAAWCEKTIKRADHFVVVSKCSVDELVDWGVDPGKITYLPNAVDTDYWSPAKEDKRLLRRRLELPEDGPYAVCVARLRPEKGHEMLLRAWRSVVDRIPGAKLLLVGEGPEAGNLTSLSREDSLGERVLFLGHRENVKDYLLAADFSILFSTIEGPAISVQESLACGLPVVATRVGGLPDSVIPGKTGLLVDPGDIRGAAGSIVSCLEDERLLARLARSARDFALENRSHTALMPRYEALLERIVDRWENENGKRVSAA